MSLTIGIVGLPNSGKSTLFNALTRNNVLAANYPFATIEPNVGVVGVPEPRLAVLGKMYQSRQVIPSTCSTVCAVAFCWLFRIRLEPFQAQGV